MASRITKERAAQRAILRKLKNPVYDTITIVAAATNLNFAFFQGPQGSAITPAGAAKTEADTNLTQASTLSDPTEFDLYGLQLEIIHDAADVLNWFADALQIYERSVINFFFASNKDWLEVPTTQVPVGPYVTGAVATADAGTPTEYGFLGNGQSSGRDFIDLTVGGDPIPIASKETFGARLRWPGGAVTSGVAYRARMFMVGVLYRGL